MISRAAFWTGRNALWYAWHAASMSVPAVQGALLSVPAAMLLSQFIPNDVVNPILIPLVESLGNQAGGHLLLSLFGGYFIGAAVVGIGLALAWRYMARQNDGRAAAAKAWRANGEVWTWQPDSESSPTTSSRLPASVRFAAKVLKNLLVAYLIGFLAAPMMVAGYQLMFTGLDIPHIANLTIHSMAWFLNPPFISLPSLASDVGLVGYTAASVGMTVRQIMRTFSGESAYSREWTATGVRWTKQPHPA